MMSVPKNDAYVCDAVSIGKRLSELRKIHGYTITQMADGLNMPETTLKGYLYGQRNASLQVLWQAVRFFHLNSIEELLGKEPTKHE